jgi:hypothetical protein
MLCCVLILKTLLLYGPRRTKTQKQNPRYETKEHPKDAHAVVANTPCVASEPLAEICRFIFDT